MARLDPHTVVLPIEVDVSRIQETFADLADAMAAALESQARALRLNATELRARAEASRTATQ